MKTEKHSAGKNPFDKLLDGMAFLAGIMMLFITLMVTYAAVLRYMQVRPPLWVLQYTEYGLLWITFLGAAWLQRMDGHIRIDTVITNLPQTIRSKLEIINTIMGCLVTLTIFYFSFRHTIDLFQRNIMEISATNVSKYLIFCIIPFGSLVLFLQFIRDTWHKISQEMTK
ncbi:TRAP transporter small permease [Desulfobacula sp.]|uniref:TRAP transporter small permease n=1 Tax=Desulfobacula sp. TaxID=2593537 RepID=UPI002635A094|nr:TRAP transporter small permease [Desulfobacula sp.]